MKNALFLFVLLLSGLKAYSTQSFSAENRFSQTPIPSDSLKKKVLKQLGFSESELRDELFEEKVLPHAKTQTVMVIPKQVDEDDGMFTIDAVIVVVNNQTGKIIQRFKEENLLYSDAIHVSGFTIDTAPYMLTKEIRAFGVRVSYKNDSGPNPYRETNLSLFIQEGNSLRRVLRNVNVTSFSGEWDTNCAGEFHSGNSLVSFETETTNGCFNLVIKERSTTTLKEKIKGECKERTIEEHEKKIIFYYNGKTYN
ncbi:hypothetical protein D3C87_234070 [compost metagenome]